MPVDVGGFIFFGILVLVAGASLLAAAAAADAQYHPIVLVIIGLNS